MVVLVVWLSRANRALVRTAGGAVSVIFGIVPRFSQGWRGGLGSVHRVPLRPTLQDAWWSRIVLLSCAAAAAAAAFVWRVTKRGGRSTQYVAMAAVSGPLLQSPGGWLSGSQRPALAP